MANILICDDERDIVSALKIYLSTEDYTLFEAYTGREALDIVRKHEIHLILMDIMMPEMDGVTATAKLREEYNIPIILLTAKSEDTDKVLGLNVGADDYITKPFNPLELVARVKTQLRRYTRYNTPREEQPPSSAIEVRGLSIDQGSHKCTLNGKEVTLTPLEFSILWHLCQRRGRVVSSEELFETVWGERYLENSSNTVMAHIARLREKLGEPPRRPRYIKTIWGVGYTVE